MNYKELINFIDYYNQLDDGINFDNIQKELFNKKNILVDDDITKQLLLEMYFND